MCFKTTPLPNNERRLTAKPTSSCTAPKRLPTIGVSIFRIIYWGPVKTPPYRKMKRAVAGDFLRRAINLRRFSSTFGQNCDRLRMPARRTPAAARRSWVPNGCVPFQAELIRLVPTDTIRCFPPVPEEHRPSSLQSGGVEDQPQYPGLWHSVSPSARSF